MHGRRRAWSGKRKSTKKIQSIVGDRFVGGLPILLCPQMQHPVPAVQRPSACTALDPAWCQARRHPSITDHTIVANVTAIFIGKRLAVARTQGGKKVPNPLDVPLIEW